MIYVLIKIGFVEVPETGTYKDKSYGKIGRNRITFFDGNYYCEEQWEKEV